VNPISKQSFGKVADGTPVELFTIRNRQNAEVRITNYGGIVQAFLMPDNSGKVADVVLGYDSLEGYLKKSPYFGCLVGRYGNRIARGKFMLNGQQYILAINNGPNALHGGIRGFDKVVWEPKILTNREGSALELGYVSKDGEEGYPGTLSVTATYNFSDDSALRLDYVATTDKDTIINLTQHSYFNLAGTGDILNHDVVIDADKFTPVDSTLIPTGELRSVTGTPFDFRRPTPIGACINQEDEQLKFAGGYDQNWVVNKEPGELKRAAIVREPASRRVLEVFSTEPGLQFYSGNFLDGSITGKAGWVYERRNGFCMEPQHFPDSPNHSGFPSVVLRPGEVYRNTIVYKISVAG
jgi:aldose 1-epimerase